jgi:hypothetical protein
MQRLIQLARLQRQPNSPKLKNQVANLNPRSAKKRKNPKANPAEVQLLLKAQVNH